MCYKSMDISREAEYPGDSMKLTSALIRSLEVGEYALITEAKGRPVVGQGDVTYLFGRMGGAKVHNQAAYPSRPRIVDY